MIGLRAIALCVALAGVCVVGGCGGSDGGATSTSELAPLTLDQAQLLAFSLFNNTQKRGAEFTIERDVDETHLVMTGQVDFVRSSGSMLLQASREGGELSRGRRISWNKTSVIEGDVPGLREAMAARGRQGVDWVVRPINANGNPIDASIGFLSRLAATRRDNPALIQQGESRYAGQDTVEGTPVSVFQTQRDLTIAVGADGLIRRAQGRLVGDETPITIVLREHGAKVVPLPPNAARVDLAAIPDLYRELITTAREAGPGG